MMTRHRASIALAALAGAICAHLLIDLAPRLVRAAAQPAPRHRPPHVEDPEPGRHYWCVVHPLDAKGRRVPVRLPWRGEVREGVWGRDIVFPSPGSPGGYAAAKANPRLLFRTERGAKEAIVWDWNHPPEGARATLAFSRATLREIEESFRLARESGRLADGAVPGLMVVDMDRAAAQALLATAALGLDVQVFPGVESDEPPR